MLQLLDRNFLVPNEALADAVARARLPGTVSRYKIATCAERPELFEASVDLENEVWDKLSFLDFTAAHETHYDYLLERFADYRVCVVEDGTDDLVATGMCVPLHVSPGTDLPHEGWDWIVECAVEQNGAAPNTIGGLTISVDPRHRQGGFARDLINTMRALAAIKRCDSVIIPVRPSAKAAHPYVSMQDYAGWLDERGRIYDPWLRSHVAVGGTIDGVCQRSMVVEQPIEFWKAWTGGPLDQDGLVAFDGAIAPLEVDIAAGVGRYVEPNVWVTHRV